jgi:hypothetical protein
MWVFKGIKAMPCGQSLAVFRNLPSPIGFNTADECHKFRETHLIGRDDGLLSIKAAIL